MKQIVAMMFALVAGVELSTSALAAETVSDAMGVTLAGTPSEPPDDKIEDPPEKREDEGDTEDPPEKREDEGDTENPPAKSGEGSGASETIVLTGVLTFDGVTTNLTEGTVTSTETNQNVILAKNSAAVTLSDYTLYKYGNSTNEDACNFFALNAVVAAKTNATIYIDNSTLNSNAKGANCLFASGDGSTIYAYKCNITSTEDSSRGLDATYEGTVIAGKMTIDTAGDHCAALATDRGNGYISVEKASLKTTGQGSPLLYSTGVIEVNCVTGTATGAQIAGIEGLSEIRIKNSVLTGSGEKASESVPNGVMIYQSNSGDSTEGTATFEVLDSSLTSTVSGGAMFYITNSKADIRVQDTELAFDSTNNYLVLAAGNDGSHGWGTAGSNGAEVMFTAIDQSLVGNIFVDAISSLDLYLTNSTYTGTIVTTNSTPDVDVFVSADSTWIVTSNCTLKSLTVAPGVTNVVDGDGNAVRIVSTSNETLVEGASELEIKVSDYTSGDVVITNTISDFSISRSKFDSTYRYYFKPHPPTNSIVKVEYGGTHLTPDMDHKYWVDELGITVTVIYATKVGYHFSDGTTRMSREVIFDTNKMDIYPLDGTVVVEDGSEGESEYSMTPGVASEAYDDAQSATNAAATINADRAGSIVVPDGVEDSSAYYEIVEATVTSDNCVVVDLTFAARSNEQVVVDAAITNTTALASLVSTNSSLMVTISPTTPGLYYWLVGGTDATAVTNVGAGVLSTDGGSIELSKPSLDATKGKAFFKIAAGVAAPAQ